MTAERKIQPQAAIAGNVFLCPHDSVNSEISEFTCANGGF